MFMDALEYSVCQDNGWTYRSTTQPKSTTQTASSDTTIQTEHQTSWESFVTQKLQTARELLCELYPLNYRVEILEDIFSLLFVRHEYFRTEGNNAQSDSGGEEGHNDDDWQNQSITSLESVDIGEQMISRSSQNLQPKEVTFTTGKADNVSGDTSGDKSGTSKSGSGILKQRISGLIGNGSSEASQYSNNSMNLQNKVGFVASEKFTCEILAILKECMLDLTSTKYSMSGKADSKPDAHHKQGKSDQMGRELAKYLKCSVKHSSLAQRISKLSQHINESWWRYQLVSQSKQSALSTRGIHESSSDEEWKSFVKDSDEEEKEDSGRKKRKKKRRNENQSRSASGEISSVHTN